MPTPMHGNLEATFTSVGCPDLAESYSLVSFEGSESLSELYEYTVLLEGETDRDLCSIGALDDMLDEDARLDINTPSGPRTLWGVVRAVEVFGQSLQGVTGVKVTMVPRLWRLSLTSRTRSFEEKTTQAIVSEVLQEHGISVGGMAVFDLSGSYTAREYTVQYRESDLDFVRRLLEHDGIFFYFTHDQQHETLRLVDANPSASPHEGLRTELYFRAGGSGALDEDVVHTLSRRRVVVPHKARVFDYNYRTPTSTVDSTAAIADSKRAAQAPPGVEYFAEHVRTNADAERIAAVRAAALATEREQCTLVTQLRGLAPGHHFTLAQHPNDELNGAYVVSSVAHSLRSRREGARGNEAAYQNRCTAFPATLRYRPPLRAPRPRVSGLLTGKIAGEESGLDAPVDDQGRYRVTFAVDSNTSMSCWARMAALTAGDGFGAHFPVHVGTEVLVGHHDGDPDRPVIVAALPHPSQLSPVSGANPTQALLRTKALIEIHLDDDA